MPPVFVVAKVMAANELPLQIVLGETVVTLAAGFTVIVKLIGVPLQLLEFEKIGVTVIVALTGAFPVLVAVNEAMSPVPLAANPMEVAVLVQLYVVVPPEFWVEKSTEAIVSPAQTVLLLTVLTCPLGFMVIVKVLEVPVQLVPPFEKVGVTVIVAWMGLVVVFTGVNTGIAPVPEVLIPIPAVVLVQV